MQNGQMPLNTEHDLSVNWQSGLHFVQAGAGFSPNSCQLLAAIATVGLERGLTSFGQSRPGCWLLLGLGRKTCPWVKLGKSCVWHRRLETLQRRKGCGRPRCRHQSVARTRPGVKSSLRADTGVQLPEGSCVCSRGHFQRIQMAKFRSNSNSLRFFFFLK